MWKPLWLRRFSAWCARPQRLAIVEGDSLPDVLPHGAVVLAREDNDDLCVGMRCPCGCGDKLELMLLREVKPHWTLTRDTQGLPTLHPSVWRRTGCKAHFWMRSGKVVWCE
jgi:hypothetical protein